MAEGYEPNPSNNWIRYYDHIMENINIALPSTYSELLFVGYAESPNLHLVAVYTIVIDKQSYLDLPDGSIMRTGYYLTATDSGAFAVRKVNNSTVLPRYVQEAGTAINATYHKLYYR